MSNSGLITYTRISPNRTAPRNHTIDTVTIHCYVGQVTAERGASGSGFTNYDPKKGSSCNYVVGYDGSRALVVPESDRSWCSSNPANDHRSITIEVASDRVHPYAVTDKAYNALIELLTDICWRNGIERLVWSENKSDRVNHLNGCNMTVHRDFAAKSCPGDYLYERHGEIATAVNERLKEMEYSQFVEFMNRLQDEQSKKPADDWAKTGIELAKAAGITDGSRPASDATRQEVMLMCKKTLDVAVKQIKDSLSGAIKG